MLTGDFLATGEVPDGEVTTDNSTASSCTTQARRWSSWLTGACLPAAMAGAMALLVGGTVTPAKAKAGEVRAGSARSRQTGNRRKWRKQRGRGAPATAAMAPVAEKKRPIGPYSGEIVGASGC
jgi:hypothetical protein